MQAVSKNIDSGWQWKQRDEQQAILDELKAGWTATKSFPSTIHPELIKAGKISDPFLGFNEHDVQWIGDVEWLYSTRFDAEIKDQAKYELVFEGLDTICDVYLNGNRILAADNMFRTYVVPVEVANLKPTENTLLLHFKSAKALAKKLEAQYGRVRAGSTNLGDPSRVYVRKAQYGWRWDWGPELMTAGPYRPVKLVTYTTKIEEVNTTAAVSADLCPSLAVDVTLAGNVAAAEKVKVTVSATDGTKVVEHDGAFKGKSGSAVRAVDWDNLAGKVKLWWPVGYGEQALYDVEVTVFDKDGAVLDKSAKRIGFRDVKLVQEPLEEADQYGKGTTFLFEINGVRIFMGGSNWIPAHNFLTELTDDSYRDWLTLLRDGNQNMIRIWGGGIYEPDIFYEVCDELGLLVWQDFQFACGVYPAHDEFVQSVKLEAEDNVKRLRHHPSIAVFCGNNEDYQMILQWGDHSELPARVLYENVLPATVKALATPGIPYWPGSPYGGVGWDTADPTVGDVHQWNIWGGKERPWHDYPVLGGRFVSEFGIPSFPDIRTVDYWLDGNTKDRWAQSPIMAQHNRAGGHERRFAIVMNDHFKLTSDLETHVYNTQIMQSEAVGLAYRAWRREWRGKGKQFTAGVLVWQANDCWPVTSWAIADHFLRAKPIYYTIARELQPITVGIIRTVTQNRANDRPKQYYEFGAFRSIAATIDIWGANATLKERAVKLEIRAFDLLSAWTETQTHDAVLLPNQSTELLSVPCPAPPQDASDPGRRVTTSHSVVVGARLLDGASGAVLARFADWPQPYRYTEHPDPGLEIAVDGERVRVQVQKPVKGLVLSVDDDGLYKPARWTDNALDVLPGDPQTVTLRGGLAGKKLKVAYMGCEKGRFI